MNDSVANVPPAIAVLAGGKSRRMGTDKALITVSSETLLERIVAEALLVSPDVMVVGRTKPADWKLGGRFFEDETPGLGPLCGLATALAQTESAVCMVACDMPALYAADFRWLFSQFESSDAEFGLSATVDEKPEPLFTVYRKPVLETVRQRLSDGKRALYRMIEAGGFDKVEVPASMHRNLMNLNRPMDLAAFLERMTGGKK